MDRKRKVSDLRSNSDNLNKKDQEQRVRCAHDELMRGVSSSFDGTNVLRTCFVKWSRTNTCLCKYMTFVRCKAPGLTGGESDMHRLNHTQIIVHCGK